jgi:hypothetical protein
MGIGDGEEREHALLSLLFSRYSSKTLAFAEPAAVTAKTAARPRSADRLSLDEATCTRFAAGAEALADCGTAAAGLRPTTLEFTPAIVLLRFLD